jgi:hypothetical protein
VIIAMAVMRVMQPSVHEVINMIAVGYGFVSAVWPVRVRAPGLGRAVRRVGVADLDSMLVDMILMHVMQMAVVEVIDMTTMAHSRVPAVRTVLMSVIRMMRIVAGGHEFARLSGACLSNLPRFLPDFPYALPISPSARTMTSEVQCHRYRERF